MGSTFVGGRAPLHKSVEAKDVYSKNRDGSVTYGGGVTAPTNNYMGGITGSNYGTPDTSGEYFYKGQSGREYSVTKGAEYTDWGGDTTNEFTGKYSFNIGSGANAYTRAGDRNAYGATSSPSKYGVDIGKTEEEARATYKDFGLDFDKDSARGDFYKTEKKRNNLQRTDAGAQEGATRKISRMRIGRTQNAASAGGRIKGKKQGNLRINTAGLQGGQSGGGTTLS
jgi:hypothetical protein